MAHSHTTDPRYGRFTHWPEPYMQAPASMSGIITQAHESFLGFYDDPDTIIQEAARGRGLHDARDEFRCFLDYVYPWLIEGDAALVCSSYEEYLIAVIGLIEIQRYRAFDPGPDRPLRRGSEGYADDVEGPPVEPFDIFYWGRRVDPAAKNTEANGERFGRHEDPTCAPYESWASRDHALRGYGDQLPHNWGGLEHPALLKSTYKAARRRKKHEHTITTQHD